MMIKDYTYRLINEGFDYCVKGNKNVLEFTDKHEYIIN